MSHRPAADGLAPHQARRSTATTRARFQMEAPARWRSSGRVQSSSSGNITDIATLSAGVPDGTPEQQHGHRDCQRLPGADLENHQAASPNPMIASNAATFTLQPRNVGPDAASTVSVTDTLPTGFTGIAASGTNWSCSVAASTVTCSRATLPTSAQPTTSRFRRRHQTIPWSHRPDVDEQHGFNQRLETPTRIPRITPARSISRFSVMAATCRSPRRSRLTRWRRARQ